MGLQDDDRNILINLRLTNAKTTLEEVDFLAQNGKWRTAANRLYYACFYAAGALLVRYGITAHTHTGVINQLGLHFVSRGLISLELGKFYRGVFSLR
ncbi:MAG: HEPN domain-containing protein, partial [Tannerella sp.]|nr:HEPN domain-containing protein [Tannerella sp.]